MAVFTVDILGQAEVLASVTIEAEDEDEAKMLAEDQVSGSDWHIRDVAIIRCEGVRRGRLKMRP